MSYLMAYDLGTGGIKASLFREDGTAVADLFHAYETFYPAEKYAEQRPDDWWQGVCLATRQLLRETSVRSDEVKAVALSGHSMVAVPFDRDGNRLLDSVPIWCDMRAYDQVPVLFRKVPYEKWYTTTGNGDPAETYTLLKLMWYREHMPALFEKADKVLGSKDYINYLLTGRMCTDPSYFSGSGAFNLRAWRPEPAFTEAAGVPASVFPEIIPSDAVVGCVTPGAALETGLAAGTPVACGGVDNMCMALGATGLSEGSLYLSLGSSAWIAVTSREPVTDVRTRPFVFAHAVPRTYTSAVSIFSAGNSFRWARDTLCPDLMKAEDAYERMNRMAEQVPPGSHGVLFNPTLAGGSAQEYGPDLTGGFLGLTLRNTREDLVRAVMEGVALALESALEILRRSVPDNGRILVCGGGSKSRVWRQILADVFDLPVVKDNIDQNAASLGAAALAANACGLWHGYDALRACHRGETVTEPDGQNTAYYRKLIPAYREWTDTLGRMSDRLKEIR